MTAIQPQEIKTELERLHSGIPMIRAVVAGLTEEQLRARPVPGKWSMLECISHMADFEPILVYRAKSMLAFDKPDLIGVDEARFTVRYDVRQLSEELDVFITTRLAMHRILSALSPADFERRGLHSELGEITVFSYVKGMSGHLEHHMKHMNDKRTALGLDSVPCPESRDYPARPVTG